MSSKKNTTPIPLQPLDELFGTAGDSANGICEVSVSSLHSFPNHPFKVNNDKKMEELVKSVTEYGVLVPGIVRMRSAGGYELVAGHRRRRACEIAGIQKMPVIIKDLTDDEATVIMVDSNIQREELLFSEKAFAYKMKYDALKRQGKRTDLTSCRVGKKSAAEEVSQNTDDSARQVLRYIHLTELITELLDLTDIKKLPFNTAVELSYLKKDERSKSIAALNNGERLCFIIKSDMRNDVRELLFEMIGWDILEAIRSGKRVSLLVLEGYKKYGDELLQLLNVSSTNISFNLFAKDFFSGHTNDWSEKINEYFHRYIYTAHSRMESCEEISAKRFGQIPVVRNSYACDRDRRIANNRVLDQLFNTNRVDHYVQHVPVWEPQYRKEEIHDMQQGVCLVQSETFEGYIDLRG